MTIYVFLKAYKRNAQKNLNGSAVPITHCRSPKAVIAKASELSEPTLNYIKIHDLKGEEPEVIFHNHTPFPLLLKHYYYFHHGSVSQPSLHEGDSRSNINANVLKNKRINFTDKEKANESYTENISYLSDLQKSTSQIQYHIGKAVGRQTFS